MSVHHRLTHSAIEIDTIEVIADLCCFLTAFSKHLDFSVELLLRFPYFYSVFNATWFCNCCKCDEAVKSTKFSRRHKKYHAIETNETPSLGQFLRLFSEPLQNPKDVNEANDTAWCCMVEIVVDGGRSSSLIESARYRPILTSAYSPQCTC